MMRARPLLIVAAAALALGGVGVVTAQNAPPPDAQPAPAPTASPAPPLDGPEGPSSLTPAEAPPSAEAPLAPVGPQVDAIENQLTAQSEAAAGAAPRPRPRRGSGAATRQAASRAGEDEVVVPAAPVPLAPRPRYATAILMGLEKTTARTVRFEAPVGRPVRYEGLIVTARACERTTPDEARQDQAVYLEVSAQPRNVRREAVQTRQVYRGWTFAQSPAVNPFGHPIYDLWLVECSGRSLPAARPAAGQTRASREGAPAA